MITLSDRKAMRALLLILLLVFIFPFDVSADGRKPLDLPSGGSGDNDEEEDAPETINFWGGEYEGDAFFWCLDKSCSMSWNGEIQDLKQEFT